MATNVATTSVSQSAEETMNLFAKQREVMEEAVKELREAKEAVRVAQEEAKRAREENKRLCEYIAELESRTAAASQEVKQVGKNVCENPDMEVRDSGAAPGKYVRTSGQRMADKREEFPSLLNIQTRQIKERETEKEVENMETQEAHVIISRKRARQESTSSSSSDGTKNDNDKPKEANEARRPPPLVLRDTRRWGNLRIEMKRDLVEIDDAKTTRDGISIKPKTGEDYRKMTRIMEKGKYPFHTYSTGEDRLLKVVVRGLNRNTDIEEIKEDLQAEGFHPENVTQMRNKKKEATDLFMVQVPRTEREIYDVKWLTSLRVRVEPLKKSNEVLQCHRCQRFGHGQRHCQAEPRCVKCPGKHWTKDCKRKDEERATCTNCREGHPASYRGCNCFPKLKKKTDSKTKPQPRVINNPQRREEGVSYAQRARNQQDSAQATQQTQQATGIMPTVQSLAENMTKMSAVLDMILQKLGC